MSKLDVLVNQINKEWKEDIAARGIKHITTKKIPFTSPRLNYMLYGGLPRGRIIEFAGEENWEDWHLESKLYAMFKDAMFFPRMNWTCFCRECANKNPTPGKHNRFGYGFSSQSSWRAALRGWENACNRACKSIIKAQLKGKIP